MDVLEHALRYAKNGYRVIPIGRAQKSPPIGKWQELATTDPDTITAWWSGPYKGCGIGIVTGRWNGRTLFVLDIDDREGKSGSDTLHDLERQHGPLPDTLSTQTGSGGRHLYFVTDETIPNSASLLGPGIDIRGHGGQVLAPPTIHPNGKPYEWMIDSPKQPAEAPAWLVTLLQRQQTPPAPSVTQTDQRDPFLHDDPKDSPAARYNDSTTWEQLLAADGWHCTRIDASGEKHWVRPGKDAREGTSATTGWQGKDICRVFTTSITNLPPGAYSRFGYTAAMHYNGDRSAFARELSKTQLPATPPIKQAEELAESIFINWSTFWTQDFKAEEWIAKPIIPRHHHVAMYAKGGTGKSLVALWLAYRLATGQELFGETQPPLNILYIDYEMSQQLLHERLKEMGATPDTDLTMLHYALLPPLHPLDTADGAKQICDIARLVQAELVIIDTFGRAVQGEENSSDTIRNYYRHTGLALKAEGRGVLRIDHAGKDAARGQRGSSGKNDDVDLVWELLRDDSGLTIKRHKHRHQWIPERVHMQLGKGHDFITIGTKGRDTWDVALEVLTKLGVAQLSQNQAYAKVKSHFADMKQDMPFNERQFRAAYKHIVDQVTQQAAEQGLSETF